MLQVAIPYNIIAQNYSDFNRKCALFAKNVTL